jgi:hypothetical protein
MKNNGLQINASKTSIVPFHANNNHYFNDFEVNLCGKSMKIDSGTKFLGIELNGSIKWNDYVDTLHKKLNSAIFSLKVISNTSDMNTMLMVYNGYFLSHVRYAILFWGGSSLAENIFRKQKKALRVITKLPGRTSCKPFFKKYKLLTVPALVYIEFAGFVKKNLNLFEKYKPNHCFQTRNKNILYYPKHNLSLLEKGPCYMGLKIFNSLPKVLRMEADSTKLTNILKNTLIKGCPYTLEECMEMVKKCMEK